MGAAAWARARGNAELADKLDNAAGERSFRQPPGWFTRLRQGIAGSGDGRWGCGRDEDNEADEDCVDRAE